MLLAADVAAAECETDPQCAVVFHEDFEPDDGGFTVDNSGGTINGFWHHSIGRRDDGLPGHSRNHAFYYGQFETIFGGGRYPVFTDHQGVLSSPEIDLSCGTSRLQFQYLLDTRTPTDEDFVEVRVLDVQNGTTEVILSRADGSLPETSGLWVTATADLSAFAGRTIELQFSFDTGDAEMIDPEGWYVDDILITAQSDCSADVSVDKTIDDEAPNEGQTIEYTITASNAVDSAGSATNVMVIDMLPDGVTFVSASESEGVYDPDTGKWGGLQLVPGEAQTLVILATVDAGTAGNVIVNLAEIMADQDDPDESGNQVTQSLTVNRVDLSVDKTADDSTPVEGQTVEFAIVVTNAATSNAAATNVQVRDTLPDGLDFVDAPGGTFDPVTRTVTWDIPSIPDTDPVTLTLFASVATGTAGQTLDNLAEVEGDETDPDLQNNTVIESVTVSPSDAADLQVAKTVDNASPVAGDLVTFTITVTNDAGSAAPATGVVVEDQLPQDLLLVSVSQGGSYDESTRVVTWSSVSIDIGASQDFVIEALVQATASGKVLENVAVAQGDNPDPDPDSNTAAVTLTAGTTVQFVAPLAVYRPDDSLASDFAPFIRPADAFADRLDEPGVLAAITPWQGFEVQNTTQETLNLTSLDTSGISELEREFVRVLQIPDVGSPVEISFPLSIPAGESESFLVTYDPAVRNDDRDMVIEQFPDWFGVNRLTHPAHRFQDDAQIVLVTDQTDDFTVRLVGGSTYDSDISYDGVVANADFVRFADLALDDIYEPTSDPNARCPNGADNVLASCVWAIDGPPPREIGFGDIAILQRENDAVSARPPFLDLDPLNLSGVAGTGFLTEADSGTASVATADAGFANQDLRILDSLTFTITNPEPGDSLRVDPTMLNPNFTYNGGSLDDLGDTTELTISGVDIVLGDYNETLQAVSFQGSASEGRLVQVSIQAVGSQSLDGPFTRLVDDSELLSNVAVARIVVPEPGFAPLAVAAESESVAPDALVLIDMCVPGSGEHRQFTSSDGATGQLDDLTTPVKSAVPFASSEDGEAASSDDSALATVVDPRVVDTAGEATMPVQSPTLLSTDEDRKWSDAVDESIGDWESFCLPLS